MSEFRRILVPTDFSESAEGAFAFALVLARAHGAEIHLLHDIEIPVETITGATTLRERLEESSATAKRKMEDLVASRRADDVVAKRALERSTDPVQSIPLYAEQNGVDLIVMGAHGHHSIREKLIGSRAERVLREGVRPVVTVALNEAAYVPRKIERILVPVDLDDPSPDALRVAGGVAAATGARIFLLRADAQDGAEEDQSRLLRLSERTVGAEDAVTIVRSPDEPADAILETARSSNVDLIVMTTHARRGLERVLKGSVTEHVVPRASCPVMVIPSR